MKILFACGGTAGHINPALAVAAYIKGRHPQADIRIAGNPKGMEARLVPQAGFPFLPIEIMGFQRQLNWFNIKYNFRSIGCFMLSGSRSRTLIRNFDPDVIVGTGGYVSGPILYQGAKMGYKTVAHEQNAFPGVTTKMLAKHVDSMLLAVEEAKRHLAPRNDYVITGNPIRGEIVFANREEARKALGVGKEQICILSFGGSLGARCINEAVSGLIAADYRDPHIHHIHATGRYGVELFPRLLQQEGVNYEGNPRLDIREYIDNMPLCLAAADLVICRAGAITLSELEAAGRASILIPSPNVAENHQYHNAMVLADKQAAVVIEEKNLTPKLLAQTVAELTQNSNRLAELGQNARSIAIIDANDRIYEEIMRVYHGDRPAR